MAVIRSAEEAEAIFSTVARPVIHRRATAAVRSSLHSWPALALAVVLLGSWELVGTRSPGTLLYFPDPSRVFTDVFDNPGLYWAATKITLFESVVGFAIGGAIAVGFAVLMAESSIVERAFLPVFIVIKVTPIVAVLPILILLMGYGSGPKVVIAAMIILYSVLVNALTGFKDLDENVLEYLRSLNASRWEIFWRLRVPNGLPHLFAAAKIGLPLAILGATVGEFLNSVSGLGNVIAQAYALIDMPRLWGATYCLVAMGLVLVGIVTVLEHRLLHWHPSRRIIT